MRTREDILSRGNSRKHKDPRVGTGLRVFQKQKGGLCDTSIMDTDDSGSVKYEREIGAFSQGLRPHSK